MNEFDNQLDRIFKQFSIDSDQAYGEYYEKAETKAKEAVKKAAEKYVIGDDDTYEALDSFSPELQRFDNRDELRAEQRQKLWNKPTEKEIR